MSLTIQTTIAPATVVKHAFTTVTDKRASARAIIQLINELGQTLDLQALRAVEAALSKTKNETMRVMFRASTLIPVPTRKGMVMEEISNHNVTTIGPCLQALMRENPVNADAVFGELDFLVRATVPLVMGNCVVSATTHGELSYPGIRDGLVGSAPIDTFTGAYGEPSV